MRVCVGGEQCYNCGHSVLVFVVSRRHYILKHMFKSLLQKDTPVCIAITAWMDETALNIIFALKSNNNNNTIFVQGKVFMNFLNLA